MLHTEFQVNYLFSSGEAKNRFSRWRPRRPYWISDLNDFSYFWSSSHLDASYQVSSQFAFRFRRRGKNRFSRWPPWRQSWISDRNEFSDFLSTKKGVREKSRECHNHKPQPFPDIKRKRKQTRLNKRKSNKRTKSTKISSLFPKRGNRKAKRTEKHKNTIRQGKT